MSKVACVLVLATLAAGLATEPARGVGQIGVYFDRQRTKRTGEPKGLGVFDTLTVVLENIPTETGLVAGAQYRIDYGPYIQYVADRDLRGAVAIGTSDQGISLGFGGTPRSGIKDTIHRALVIWQADSCDATIKNIDFPRVERHPDFPDATPVVTPYPIPIPDVTLPVFGARAQICQFVEMDIRPGTCPNPFNDALWGITLGSSDRKAGVVPVAILGSATVNADSIDAGSCRLEGVSPIPGASSLEDVATADDSADCACSGASGDGRPDVRLFFGAEDVAAAIPPANPGDTLTLILTGVYLDGMPFTASDCVIVVDGGTPAPLPSSAALGLPSPNPFNPSTRIVYTLPARQHVNLSVYDIEGRLVANLIDSVEDPGDHVVDWHASRLASGVYFYRLRTGSDVIVRRATLLK